MGTSFRTPRSSENSLGAPKTQGFPEVFSKEKKLSHTFLPGENEGFFSPPIDISVSSFPLSQSVTRSMGFFLSQTES